MPDDVSLKKLSLYGLIASVSVSALLGIIVILAGNFGSTEIKILLSTLTISGVSLCCLSCGALIEGRGQRALPFAGILLALAAGGLAIVGMWGELPSAEFWKTVVTLTVFAVATAHVSLLLLARLAPRYAWARIASFVAVYGVAAIIAAMLWGEIDGPGIFQFLAVASILDAAITIVVPVLHRLSSDDPTHGTASDGDTGDATRDVAALDREIERLRGQLAELERRRDRIREQTA